MELKNRNNKSRIMEMIACNNCGYYHREETIFGLAQNVNDTCRQYGCFGNMKVMSRKKQLKIRRTYLRNWKKAFTL